MMKNKHVLVCDDCNNFKWINLENAVFRIYDLKRKLKQSIDSSTIEYFIWAIELDNKLYTRIYDIFNPNVSYYIDHLECQTPTELFIALETRNLIA